MYKQEYAPELCDIYYSAPKYGIDDIRWVLRSGNMWQGVSLRLECFYKAEQPQVGSLIEMAFINGILALRKRNMQYDPAA